MWMAEPLRPCILLPPRMLGVLQKSKTYSYFIKFSPHSLRNPERIKVRDIILYADKTYWVLPHFQRYFSWKKENIRGFLKAIFNDYYISYTIYSCQ